VPKTRPDFWAVKRGGTVERDAKNLAALKDAGWKVIVIWECQMGTDEELLQSLKSVLPIPA
jgi:DNA mismatch endonuclease (patch repair protein)